MWGGVKLANLLVAGCDMMLTELGIAEPVRKATASPFRGRGAPGYVRPEAKYGGDHPRPEAVGLLVDKVGSHRVLREIE